MIAELAMYRWHIARPIAVRHRAVQHRAVRHRAVRHRAVRHRAVLQAASVWVCLGGLSGCERKPEPQDLTPPGARAPALVSAAAPAVASAAPIPGACPSDMVLAEGLFCNEVEQSCQTPGSAGTSCQHYRPTRCLSEQKQLLRVCIDRYEWPNQLGQKPLVLVTFDEAERLCESASKRLCDAQEWSFACEGEPMLPYSYGYERDPTRCVIDRLAAKGDSPLAPYDECMDSDTCRAAFGKLDQREPAGSFRDCVSPAGAHDMTGNASEWVRLLGPNPGHGAKGGYWGPGPDHCRATTRASSDTELSPERGFRCCRNAHPG